MIEKYEPGDIVKITYPGLIGEEYETDYMLIYERVESTNPYKTIVYKVRFLLEDRETTVNIATFNPEKVA